MYLHLRCSRFYFRRRNTNVNHSIHSVVDILQAICRHSVLCVSVLLTKGALQTLSPNILNNCKCERTLTIGRARIGAEIFSIQCIEIFNSKWTNKEHIQSTHCFKSIVLCLKRAFQVWISSALFVVCIFLDFLDFLSAFSASGFILIG